MSKLYEEYLKLKKDNNDVIYLFKSGIFYIALENDARTLNEKLGFKLTNLNENVVKCGFPQQKLDTYINIIKNLEFNVEIIDSKYEKIGNYSDYLNNNKLKDVITQILNTDMDNISFRDSFYFLEKIKKEIEEIYNYCIPILDFLLFSIYLF